MYLAMARTVLEDKPSLPVGGGVFTPAALVGSGGPAAVSVFVELMAAYRAHTCAPALKVAVPGQEGVSRPDASE